MDAAEIVALIGAALAVFGSIGATVRWAATQFRSQGAKLAKLESEYAALYREHSLVLVRLERFRLAFQMVASELSRKSPAISPWSMPRRFSMKASRSSQIFLPT